MGIYIREISEVKNLLKKVGIFLSRVFFWIVPALCETFTDDLDDSYQMIVTSLLLILGVLFLITMYIIFMFFGQSVSFGYGEIIFITLPIPIIATIVGMALYLIAGFLYWQHDKNWS